MIVHYARVGDNCRVTKLFLAVFCAGVASSQGMLTTIAGAQSFYAGAPAVATSVEFGELGGMTTDSPVD